MADKRRMSLSFSMSQPEQKAAWDRLSAIRPGRRLDAVCRMINGYMEQRELLESIRNILREELTGVSVSKNHTQPKEAGDVGADVLGFLRALQEGDEIT